MLPSARDPFVLSRRMQHRSREGLEQRGFAQGQLPGTDAAASPWPIPSRVALPPCEPRGHEGRPPGSLARHPRPHTAIGGRENPPKRPHASVRRERGANVSGADPSRPPQLAASRDRRLHRCGASGVTGNPWPIPYSSANRKTVESQPTKIAAVTSVSKVAMRCLLALGGILTRRSQLRCEPVHRSLRCQSPGSAGIRRDERTGGVDPPTRPGPCRNRPLITRAFFRLMYTIQCSTSIPAA